MMSGAGFIISYDSLDADPLNESMARMLGCWVAPVGAMGAPTLSSTEIHRAGYSKSLDAEPPRGFDNVELA